MYRTTGKTPCSRLVRLITRLPRAVRLVFRALARRDLCRGLVHRLVRLGLLLGYLVDPASSHMLVSKIKPCMSKYKQLIL